MKDPAIAFIDDKEGKPIGIERNIGKARSSFAGNSDGDLAMLQWATAGDGPRFGMIVHHTDGVREYAYDRDSAIGRLTRRWTPPPAAGWTVVDMAKGLGEGLHWRSVTGRSEGFEPPNSCSQKQARYQTALHSDAPSS